MDIEKQVEELAIKMSKPMERFLKSGDGDFVDTAAVMFDSVVLIASVAICSLSETTDITPKESYQFFCTQVEDRVSSLILRRHGE